MPVSSNTLFHFTKTLDNLFGILENDFIPKYSLEKFYINKKKLEFAFPMVCFCDIPITQFRNHWKVYGYYGIGLTKKWGRNQGLNPILYLERKSRLSKDISLIVNKISDSGDSTKLGIDPNIGKFLMHIKQFKGTFIHREKTYSNYQFYDEREWRYVPKKVEHIFSSDFKIDRIKSHYNSLVANDRLTFKPDDIKYVIINNYKELDLVISKLKKNKSKFSGEMIDRVISRIITVEQIREDF